ncbi:hypothetical protein K0M31_011465 [Melipona bicolor]|uniref:Uncharacterized protein n=1 Tax=Melipona bicolor TaxID=60889 RepID=A0AA40KUS5_9HYME|nr:hypothetical protein K0M31_011465 [Melipona bicolor]
MAGALRRKTGSKSEIVALIDHSGVDDPGSDHQRWHFFLSNEKNRKWCQLIQAFVTSLARRLIKILDQWSVERKWMVRGRNKKTIFIERSITTFEHGFSTERKKIASKMDSFVQTNFNPTLVQSQVTLVNLPRT